MKILSNYLKKNNFNLEVNYKDFKPLLDLVVDCLDSTDNSMISNALKVIHSVIKWPPMKNKLPLIFN